MKATRVEALTFLRFIAAVVVVFFHYGQKTALGLLAQPAIISGPQMVTFFFVLSGFVLMVAYFPVQKPLKGYYLARIARIAPIYMLALALYCFFQYGRKGFHDYLPLFLSLTFLQSWFPNYPLTLNTPAWSLSVEAFFYLTFPLLVWGIRNSKVRPRTFLVVATAIWLFTQLILTHLLNSDFYQGYPSASFDIIFYFPLSHYASFLMGVAGGHLFIETREWHENSGRWAWLALILSFGFVYFLLQYPGLYQAPLGLSLPTGASLYAPAFLLLVLSVAYAKNLFTRLLALPPLVVLGEASYSVYILQKPVYLAYIKYITNRLGLSGDADFYAYLLILVCTSLLSFYVVEKPARKLILRFEDFAHTFYENLRLRLRPAR